MELTLIERDIRHKEEYLNRCKTNLAYLKKSPQRKDEIHLAEYEVFYLCDQLEKYYSLYAILHQDQHVSHDELLQKV